MKWKYRTPACAAIALGLVWVSGSSAVAQQHSLETRKQAHACARLARPALYDVRRRARKLNLKQIQKQMLDITKQLGNNAQFRQALGCTRRNQAAK